VMGTVWQENEANDTRMSRRILRFRFISSPQGPQIAQYLLL
jgi:hypothetical protein